MKKEIFKYDKYSLVTRSDFDGLVCAMILKDIGILDDIKFVHPKDVQDGKVEVRIKTLLQTFLTMIGQGSSLTTMTRRR